MAANDGSGQQTSGLAASTRHPRHLPTPIITQHSKMAFRNDADQGTVQHRPQKSLPPISQLVNGNDSSSVQGGPLSSSTQTMEAWHELRNSPGPTFDANEVMKKALETMNQQIRDNGYDPDNLPNRNPPTRANGTRPPSGHVEEVNEEPQANVYQVRADDIGLGHRIPGVGHLGDLLTPPGWKPGDEPVSLNRARLLRNQAYEAARKKMNDSTAEFKDLKGAAFQEASDLKNEEWQNQNNLNKLIYDERVKVWKDSQDRKLKGSQDSSKVLPVRGLAQANDGHQPAQPVLNRPQARNPRTRRPALPAITVSRPADGSGRPEPSPKLLSPSFLDPELVPGTFQAVVQGYRQRKTELEQSFRDNELQLRQCLTRYGPHISPAHQSLQQAPAPAQLNTTPDDQAAQQAPSTRLRLHAQQAQMHQANGNGQQNYGSVYGPTAQQPQRRATYPTPPPAYPPPAYPAEHSESYARAGNEQETRGHKNGSRALTTSRYSAHVDQNGLGIYDDEPTELALTPQKPQRHGQQAEQDADADAEPTNTPSKKRNAPTKKPTPKKPAARPSPRSTTKSKSTATATAGTKKQSWYAPHLSGANLPTTNISAEALQAGLAYDPKDPRPRAQQQPPTKKRRRGSEPAPVPKFVVSEDKIRLLFKSGMPVRYIGPGPNPYLDNKDDGGVDAKAGGAKAGAKAAAAVASMSNSGAGGDSSKAKATGRSKGSPALLVDEASITLSSGYTTTESKADDPNDGTYGAASRKLSAGAGAAAAPPKRVSPRKSSSTLGKRARGGEDE